MSPPEAKDYGIIDAVYSASVSPLAGKGLAGDTTDSGEAVAGPHDGKGPAAATD
jgi:hypothetical protein